MQTCAVCCVVCRQDCNTSLVRACWNELFTLGLAQCAQVMSLSTILAAIVNHLQNSIQEGGFAAGVLCCAGTAGDIARELFPGGWWHCSAGSRGRTVLLLRNCPSPGDLQLLSRWPRRALGGAGVSVGGTGTRLEDVFACRLHLSSSAGKGILRLGCPQSFPASQMEFFSS